MPYQDKSYYKPGCWNVICDVCGWQFKSDEVKHRWDGRIVCEKDWETDHPQKYIRSRPDPKPVPFVRREQEPVFIEVTYADGG